TERLCHEAIQTLRLARDRFSPPPPFCKRSGLTSSSDAADRVNEARPALDLRSLDEIGRLASVLAQPLLQVAEVIAGVPGAFWQGGVALHRANGLPRERPMRVPDVRTSGVDRF